VSLWRAERDIDHEVAPGGIESGGRLGPEGAGSGGLTTEGKGRDISNFCAVDS